MNRPARKSELFELFVHIKFYQKNCPRLITCWQEKKQSQARQPGTVEDMHLNKHNRSSIIKQFLIQILL